MRLKNILSICLNPKVLSLPTFVAPPFNSDFESVGSVLGRLVDAGLNVGNSVGELLGYSGSPPPLQIKICKYEHKPFTIA